MPTVRLRNVHPLGDVDIPAIGRSEETCVKAGEEFDCPSELVGEAPGTWRAPTDAERVEGYRGLLTREAGDAPNVRVEVLSPGRGLLGSRNFEVVQPPKSAGKNTPTTAPQEA